MATGKQSPQSTLPPLTYKQLNTTTWGAGGNTCTITDEYIHPNSQVVVLVTGATAAAGRWAYAITQGQVVITSSDAESSSLPLSYVIY